MLELIDIGGEAYYRDLGQPAAESEATSTAFDHLAEAQGVIYLFDPIGERYNWDSAAHMRATVNELLERAAENERRPGRYLPHQVSVCITKFDHPEIFTRARRAGLVIYGDDGMPRVPDEDAEEFFDLLCSSRFWDKRDDHDQQSARFVRDMIRGVFHPERIRYFVTSSIGFWVGTVHRGQAQRLVQFERFLKLLRKGCSTCYQRQGPPNQCAGSADQPPAADSRCGITRGSDFGDRF